MDYPVERFTEDERRLLEPHFTNLDQPVFALVNLPETVKGALFARYSRYPGTLRRLFLDEFAADVAGNAGAWDTEEQGSRAAREPCSSVSHAPASPATSAANSSRNRRRSVPG